MTKLGIKKQEDFRVNCFVSGKLPQSNLKNVLLMHMDLILVYEIKKLQAAIFFTSCFLTSNMLLVIPPYPVPFPKSFIFFFSFLVN